MAPPSSPLVPQLPPPARMRFKRKHCATHNPEAVGASRPHYRSAWASSHETLELRPRTTDRGREASPGQRVRGRAANAAFRMSEDQSKSTVQQQKHAGESGASAAGEGTLRNFAELEQHFDRIKTLHAQTAQRETEL